MKKTEQGAPSSEPPAPKQSREQGRLTPLTPEQTKGIVEIMERKGATFFNLEEFQKLTKDLPPSTRIIDILRFLRRGKK